MRNQSIKHFFKPTQNPESRVVNSSTGSITSNDTCKLLPASGVSCSTKRGSQSKRRRKMPIQSPSRSPIIDAFLRRQRIENHAIVSHFQCAKCHMTLLSPKVVVKKLVLPINHVYDVKPREQENEADVSKSPQHTYSSTSCLLPDLEHSEGNCRSINMFQIPIHQRNTCSTPKSLTSDSRYQAAHQERRQQKEGKVHQTYQETFSPGSTGSDENVCQGNLSSENHSSSPLTEHNSDDDFEDCKSSKRKLFSSSVQNSPSLSKIISLSLGKEKSDLEDTSYSSIFVEHSKSRSPLGKNTTLHENEGMQRLLEGSEGLESSITSNNATKNAFDTQSLFLETSVASSDSSNISSSSESSSDLSFSSNGKRKKRRKKILSSDEEEEMLQPLDEIMNMASKPLPATPDKPFLELATFSSPQTPAQKNTFIAPRPAAYINSLARLVKEKEESERVNEMERQLQEDLERGMGKFFSDAEESFEEGQLADEHKEFLKKYSVVMNDIPDQPPGEEIFQLPASGMIFNHRTLNLRHSGFSSPNPEENLIFSCDAANQLMLASEGFLVFLYRFKRCPAILTKWMFQMVSVHPSYIVSVKILNTLIEIICNSFSNAELKESPWIPSLLDVATVFSNMGVSFQTLFPLQHLQPTFGYNDLVSAVPVSVGQIENPNGYIQAFTSVPKMQITNVIKFLGFCTAVCTENFSDWEIRLLLVLLLKMHLEKLLQYAPVVDLHCLVTNLLENIRDWETEMPVLAMALSELSSHHHNFVKLVELVPASHTRGRQVRRQMCLIFISKLVEENFSSIPLDYDSQMSFLCQCMVQMKPSALLKKMQRNLENNPSIHLELDREAYYLTFNLLNLVNVASTSEENPSIQRKYLLRLCTALEKHIKCDIREDPRIFYRTKVKDLVARIYAKWQELLNCSRPNQGKLHDYWEPLRENQSPSSSQEECTNCVSA